jgi:hypothetical protein
MTRDFPIVAWSAVLVETGRGAELAAGAVGVVVSVTAGAAGVNAAGRIGSLGFTGVVVGWLVGFHMGKNPFVNYGVRG